MTPPDAHVRPLLGAFVLGHLEPDESAAVRAHLDGCAVCRDEGAQLAAVARLLPLADPERVGAPQESPPEMLGEVVARIEQERAARLRARRRSVAVRVGAAAAALTVMLVVGLTSRSSEQPEGEFVAMTATRPGIAGEAVIHEDPGSTWVELTVSGLPAGETYGVWLEETDTGERSPLGTFTGVPGDLYISLYSTLPRERAGSIGVSSSDGSTMLAGSILGEGPADPGTAEPSS
jgi:hypothetical protein